MVEGQHEGMTAQLMFNTLEVYDEDDEDNEDEDDEDDDDDEDDEDDDDPQKFRNGARVRARDEDEDEVPRKVTEVRNLVTREVNIHQKIGDVINSFITDDVQIDEFKPLDKRLPVKKAISFREWYQLARENDFVLKYRGAKLNLKTELSSLGAGYNKKTGQLDDPIVIKINCIPKSLIK